MDTISQRPKLVKRKSKLDAWKVSHPENYHKAKTVSDKILHALQSSTAHVIILVLLVIDIILVTVSIIIEIEALNHELRECEDVVDTCREHNDIGVCNTDELENESFSHVEDGLAYASMSILVIFILENLMLLFAEPCDFITSPMHVLDFVVVVVSLILEIVFHNNPEGGLLIIARTWRFARIGHGVYESREDEMENKMVLALRDANQHEDIVKAYLVLQQARQQHGSRKQGLDASPTHAAVKALCQDKTDMMIELIDAVGPFLQHYHGWSVHEMLLRVGATGHPDHSEHTLIQPLSDEDVL